MPDNESKFIPSEEIPEEADRPKTPEQTQADFRLGPEVEAVIMEKVQDINAPGTVFTAIRDLKVDRDEVDTLKSIMKNGILGGVGEPLPEDEMKIKWQDAARKKKATVFLNILGEHSELRELAWFNSGKTEVGLVLNMKGFKRVMPQRWYGPKAGDSFVGKAKSIRPDAASLETAHNQIIEQAYSLGLDRNSTMSEFIDFVKTNREHFQVGQKEIDNFLSDPTFYIDSEYGFVATPRVAPRNIQGIVLRPLKRDGISWIEDPSEDAFKEKLRIVVGAMTDATKNKPSSLVPVYSYFGDLIWPRYKSNFDISRSIPGREEKK